MRDKHDLSKLDTEPDTCMPAQKEADAIQRCRELIGSWNGSPDFNNFATGLKKALTVPKDDYKQQMLNKKKKT